MTKPAPPLTPGDVEVLVQVWRIVERDQHGTPVRTELEGEVWVPAEQRDGGGYDLRYRPLGPMRRALGGTARCDWEDGEAGHCAGTVERTAWGRDVWWTCKRHHNLCLRRWYPRLPSRT